MNNTTVHGVGVLALEDGTLFRGYLFGARDPQRIETNGGGEIVFNTAMSGYSEVLTDPSYTGQVVVMTYPHIGNYGSSPLWSETAPEDGASRPAIKVAGFVVRELYDGAIASERMQLETYLRHNDIPGLCDVDTRRLTLHLRERGELRGAIFAAPPGFRRWDPLNNLPRRWLADCQRRLETIEPMVGRSLVQQVGVGRRTRYNPDGKYHVLLLDCGAKANILRELAQRDCRITLLPEGSDSASSLLAELRPDLVVVSNGPGDPAPLTTQVGFVRSLLDRAPLLGICLGHQLIALALGARTYKLKFGHHGVNHPVRDEIGGQVFVTSQNHGFAVEEQSLPADAVVWFRNANDGTIEGLRIDQRRIYSTQFHPEAAPGPHDARWIFDYVLKRALS